MFDSCLYFGEREAVVQSDFAQGVSYGIDGVPTTFIVSKKDFIYTDYLASLESSGSIKVLQKKNGAVIRV